MAFSVDGWEDQAGGHCLPACQHPQQQQTGTLQQHPLQLGLAVGETPALWLCLQRDPSSSWDNYGPTVPKDPCMGQTSHTSSPAPSRGQKEETFPPQPHLSLLEDLCDSHPMMVAYYVGPPLYRLFF